MDDTIRQDLVEPQPRWMTQAALAAKNKLVLSHTGLTISRRQFSNGHWRDERRATAPDSTIISQPRAARRQSTMAQDPETIVFSQRAIYDTRAVQSRQDQRLAPLSGLQTLAKSKSPQILKLTHPDKAATILPVKVWQPVNAGGGGATRYAEGGELAPQAVDPLAVNSRTMHAGAPRPASVTMVPLQQPQGNRPAFLGAAKESTARGVAPAAPGVPLVGRTAPDEAQSRPDQRTTTPPVAELMRSRSFAPPACKWTSFPSASGPQTPFAPLNPGQNDPADTAALRGEAGTPGPGTPSSSVYSAPDATRVVAATDGGGSSSFPRSGPTEGDVYLDGTLVGRWMARALTQAAARQPNSGAAFDPTRSRLPVGTMIGV